MRINGAGDGILFAIGAFVVVALVLSRRAAAGGPTPAQQQAARDGLKGLEPEWWV